MVSKATSARLLKLLFNLCFGILFFDALAVVEWIVVLAMMPRLPIARMVPLIVVLLGTQVVALVFYLWKPWVSVLMAWLGIFIIAARAIPWGTPSWLSTARQFEFQIVFLVVAHAGFGLYVLVHRAEARMVSELVSDAGSSLVAENEATESADSQTPSS